MSARLLRLAQLLALAAVAALLALLVWRVTAVDEGGAADALDRGEAVEAPALAFERLDVEGGVLDLTSLRGKAVVVNFWASWCIPCKDEAPFLEETWRRYRAAGLVVVGVDAQDFRADARRFIRRYGITYPVVYDGRGASLAAWGVAGFPETFFVDRAGRLVGERLQGGVDAPRNREAFERNIALALGQGT